MEIRQLNDCIKVMAIENTLSDHPEIKEISNKDLNWHYETFDWDFCKVGDRRFWTKVYGGSISNEFKYEDFGIE